MYLRVLQAIVAGLLLCFVSAASAATRNYTLYIEPGTLIVGNSGGASIAAWSYTDVSGSPKWPGPVLTALEGDTVNITVYNDHDINHNFKIQGLTTDETAIAPGDYKLYSFTLGSSSAGTYLYRDTLNSAINREMGMYGMMWVGPANRSNTAWTGGPAYDFQRTWVVGDMDKARWNDVAGSGGNVNTSVYRPNYFLINGQGGFDGMQDPATTIEGTAGDTVLVRIVNGGQFSHSLHFHANHFRVLTVNNVRQPSPYIQRDTINLPPLGTADVLYPLKQPGIYPMHNHTAQMETANGVYLNGVATMIIVH